jgi:hypothetical protein
MLGLPKHQLLSGDFASMMLFKTLADEFSVSHTAAIGKAKAINSIR